MEDKDKICSYLAVVLMNTREYSDMTNLFYNEVDEVVTAVFPSRWIEINVAMEAESQWFGTSSRHFRKNTSEGLAYE